MFLNFQFSIFCDNKQTMLTFSDKGPQKREKQTKINKIKYHEGSL